MVSSLWLPRPGFESLCAAVLNQQPGTSNSQLLLHSRQLHSRQATREAGLAHLLEHLFHLRVLAEQIVDFLNAGAGSAGDALAPASIDDLMVIAFIARHRIDDGLYSVHLFLVDFVGSFLQSLKRSDRREHPDNALQRSHLAHG